MSPMFSQTFRPMSMLRSGALVAMAAGMMLPSRASAAASPYVLKDAEVQTLPTSSNGRDYVLYVSFPLSYATSGPTRRYPVIYMLDGFWDFPLVAQIADFVRRDGHAPESIVVGIGYGGTNPNVGLLRQWDLTPGIDAQYDSTGATTGHAQEFLAVIESQIIPFVDATYRSDTSYRVLLGNSFGGLFALYALFERPGLFQGVVVSSPSLAWRDEYVLTRAQQHAAGGTALNARVYVGWASGDYEEISGTARNFAEETARLNIPGLRIVAREVEGGGHNGTKPENFTRGLRFAFAPQSWVPVVGMDPGFGTLGRMVNLSTRGRVDGGQNVLIGGLVVDGVLPKRMLIRAAGPSLGPLGVTEPLLNPRFRVVNSQNVTVAENDNWGAAPDQPALLTATTESGAFAFPAGSNDAAMIVRLEPGQYTVVVESVGGSAGVALVEAYELKP